MTTEKECLNKKHIPYFSYACPKCKNKCDKQKEPLPSGNWCDCECKHNTLWCHKCNKKVGRKDGYFRWTIDEREVGELAK